MYAQPYSGLYPSLPILAPHDPFHAMSGFIFHPRPMNAIALGSPPFGTGGGLAVEPPQRLWPRQFHPLKSEVSPQVSTVQPLAPPQAKCITSGVSRGFPTPGRSEALQAQDGCTGQSQQPGRRGGAEEQEHPPKTQEEGKKKIGRRKTYSLEDEQKLLSLVKKYGDKNWATIAHDMPGRTRKQLREHYVYYLKDPEHISVFTPAEDAWILTAVKREGRVWCRLAERLPGKTAIMIKNRYYSKLRKLSLKSKCQSKTQSPLQPPVQPPAVALELANFSERPCGIAQEVLHPSLDSAVRVNPETILRPSHISPSIQKETGSPS